MYGNATYGSLIYGGIGGGATVVAVGAVTLTVTAVAETSKFGVAHVESAVSLTTSNPAIASIDLGWQENVGVQTLNVSQPSPGLTFGFIYTHGTQPTVTPSLPTPTYTTEERTISPTNIRECDVCGFQYKMRDLRKRWDGLIVCKWDYEEKHPRDKRHYKRSGSENKPRYPWTQNIP